MASNISDKAHIAPGAKIGDGCTIHPFAYIEGDVEIGDGCTIYPFVSILDGTRMGGGNTVYQGTVLAAIPQDAEYCGESSRLVIGDGNTFRENVVVNKATHAGACTKIGNGNFLMEGTHISHDTQVGDGCVFGYGVKVAVHCHIGDYAIFSSGVIQNARTRVGDMAMVQSGCAFCKDIPPYIIAGGTPAKYQGPNKPLMDKRGIDAKVQSHIANAYRLVFHGQNSLFDSILQINEQVPDSVEIRNIVSFLESSKAGVITKV